MENDLPTNSDSLKEKIHEIHNYMRNNGIGYGLTSLKVFNLLYGLMKIEDYGLNEKIGLNDEICKFSNLLKLANHPKNYIYIIENLHKENGILDIIYENPKIKSLIGYNIPCDLKYDVYNHLIREINSIKEIEKSTNEQLSGKIYEYFVGRDQSAISELGAYFTNRRIVEFILNKIKPEIKSNGDIPKMIDMFGGSGGFTIGYMNYLNNNFKIDWSNQINNIYHFDINDDVLKSASLELFCLSGGEIPDMKNNIKRTNSFKQEFKDDYGKFDLILTNPPYGGDKIATSIRKEKREKIIKYIDNQIEIFKNNLFKNDIIKSNKFKIDKIIKNIENDKELSEIKDNQDFKRIKKLLNQSNELKKENKIEIENNKKLCVNIDSCSPDIIKFAQKHKLTGTDKEACSLMLIMDLLEMNGTAVGVLKEGLFFDSSYKDLRKVLLTQFNVKEIISVPSNQFENTSTKTSIVIFKREEEKTSFINFSELKVNLYENDEFIETDDNIIKLKHNKGDIKNVEEVFINSVSIDEILMNDTISLNSKDYNNVSIECGEGFKLVKIKDICEFYKYKYQKEDINGLFNYYSCSNIVKKCNNPNISGEYLLLGTRGTIIDALHYVNGKFGCNNNMLIFNTKNNNIYLYYIINIVKNLINNYITGSTIPMISKNKFEELELPIPETPELLQYWENKIYIPYNLKLQKEKIFKEIEKEIQMKIKDIQDNYEYNELKLGDIINYISKKNKYNANDGYKFGKYKFFTSSQINILYRNDYEFEDTYILLGRGGNMSIHISNKFSVSHDDVYVINTKNINIYYIYYLLILNKNLIIETFKGSTIKHTSKTKLNEIKIKLPKDKSLIDNLQPLFNEVEILQKEIKELDETYNQYLQELSKSAIKNQEILNIKSNEYNYEIKNKKEEIENDSSNEQEIQSIKSQTIKELKEQCKSLGIKGYSNKNKDELIEMIKNHK